MVYSKGRMASRKKSDDGDLKRKLPAKSPNPWCRKMSAVTSTNAPGPSPVPSVSPALESSRILTPTAPISKNHRLVEGDEHDVSVAFTVAGFDGSPCGLVRGVARSDLLINCNPST